jgi:hypothetical protein
VDWVRSVLLGKLISDTTGQDIVSGAIGNVKG